MNCDSLARMYRWIEYAAFGRRLERHRLQFLQAAETSRKALLLGDGDGRFLAALALSNSQVEIDSVELSSRMIAVAQQRLSKLATGPRRSLIKWIASDARSAPFPCAQYDLIVTNFLLDCFSDDDVYTLASRIRTAAVPGARWIISEFRKPAGGWRSWHASVWLRSMYLFFRVATKLETQHLPDYASALISNGFTLAAENSSMAGLLASELWILNASGTGECF